MVGVKIASEEAGVVEKAALDQQGQGRCAVVPRRRAIAQGWMTDETLQNSHAPLQAASFFGRSLGAGILVAVSVMGYLVPGGQDRLDRVGEGLGGVARDEESGRELVVRQQLQDAGHTDPRPELSA
jgi:hypothetical protein